MHPRACLQRPLCPRAPRCSGAPFFLLHGLSCPLTMNLRGALAQPQHLDPPSLGSDLSQSPSPTGAVVLPQAKQRTAAWFCKGPHV